MQLKMTPQSIMLKKVRLHIALPTKQALKLLRHANGLYTAPEGCRSRADRSPAAAAQWSERSKNRGPARDPCSAAAPTKGGSDTHFSSALHSSRAGQINTLDTLVLTDVKIS